MWAWKPLLVLLSLVGLQAFANNPSPITFWLSWGSMVVVIAIGLYHWNPLCAVCGWGLLWIGALCNGIAIAANGYSMPVSSHIWGGADTSRWHEMTSATLFPWLCDVFDDGTSIGDWFLCFGSIVLGMAALIEVLRWSQLNRETATR